jgi:hypothetical protein
VKRQQRRAKTIPELFRDGKDLDRAIKDAVREAIGAPSTPRARKATARSKPKRTPRR